MESGLLGGIIIGLLAWFLVRCVIGGFYAVDQNQRAVKTVFGRAQRIGAATTLDDPIAESLRESERQRYVCPQVRVIMPGGPYFRWPWESIHKVSVATETRNMAYDPLSPAANSGGTVLEAVTKDPTVTDAMFEILETQRILAGEGDLVLVPKGGSGVLASLLASEGSPGAASTDSGTS